MTYLIASVQIDLIPDKIDRFAKIIRRAKFCLSLSLIANLSMIKIDI